ncbi:hypothetical protein E4U21_001445 [Claviceps maximensis]|nr:hypothetical protein E4U21_001445 [Claviceps maximensis]
MLVPSALRVAGMAIMYAASVGASPPDITFSCHHMPEICTNMCWAMRCAQPRFPQTLTWDRQAVSGPVMHANLKASGCRIADSRCREKPGRQGHMGGIFYLCNEYPFFLTVESSQARGHAVSRCVRRKTNQLQSKQLRAMYEPWMEQGLETHPVRIGLRNPGYKGVNYCLNQPCVNDGFEIQDGMVKTETEAESRVVSGRHGGGGRTRRDEAGEGEDEDEGEDPTPMFRFFKTGSGAVVASMEAWTEGMNFTRALDDDEDGVGVGVGGGGGGGEKQGMLPDQWMAKVQEERARYVSDVLLEEVSAHVAADMSAID